VDDDSVTVHLHQHRALERVDNQRLDSAHECDEFVVSNISCRYEKKTLRRAVQQMAVEEVMVLRDHNTPIAIRDSGDLGVGRPIAVGKFTGMYDVVTKQDKCLSKPERQLSIDEQFHAAVIGTEERVRVTSAAYSNEARMSSASRSG